MFYKVLCRLKLLLSSFLILGYYFIRPQRTANREALIVLKYRSLKKLFDNKHHLTWVYFDRFLNK